jgi:hypothetical protein
MLREVARQNPNRRVSATMHIQLFKLLNRTCPKPNNPRLCAVHTCEKARRHLGLHVLSSVTQENEKARDHPNFVDVDGVTVWLYSDVDGNPS